RTVFQKILDVIAGGKYAGATGDDEAADVRIVLRGIDGLAHRAIHVLRDRVLFLGPAHGDHAGRVLVDNYEVVRHLVSSNKATLRLAGLLMHTNTLRQRPT